MDAINNFPPSKLFFSKKENINSHCDNVEITTETLCLLIKYKKLILERL